MKYKVLGLFFLSLWIFNGSLAQDTINWSPGYKLTWVDFQCKPDSLSEFGAVTYAGVRYSSSFSDKFLTFKVYCYFNKKISWVRVKSDYGLIHEQGHFNIAELFARKLRKGFKDYKFNLATVDKDLKTIFEQMKNERKKMDSLFDLGTDFSRNNMGQKHWNLKITYELQKLEAYR
jgi:hypothetical protein